VLLPTDEDPVESGTTRKFLAAIFLIFREVATPSSAGFWRCLRWTCVLEVPLPPEDPAVPSARDECAPPPPLLLRLDCWGAVPVVKGVTMEKFANRLEMLCVELPRGPVDG